MRQLQPLSGETAVSPTTTNQHAGSEAARGGGATLSSSAASSSSAVARVRTTCRITGNNFPSPSSWLLSSAATTASRVFFFLSLPPHARCFLRRCPGARAASYFFQHRRTSCQPRARRTPEQVPRGTEGEWQRLSPSASGRPCHRGTYGPGEERRSMFLGKLLLLLLLFYRTWLLPPRSSRLRLSLF